MKALYLATARWLLALATAMRERTSTLHDFDVWSERVQVLTAVTKS